MEQTIRPTGDFASVYGQLPLLHSLLALSLLQSKLRTLIFQEVPIRVKAKSKRRNTENHSTEALLRWSYAECPQQMRIPPLGRRNGGLCLWLRDIFSVASFSSPCRTVFIDCAVTDRSFPRIICEVH